MALLPLRFRRTDEGRASRRRARRDGRHGKPRLEYLEDRLAPALSTWIGGLDGLWSNAANWDTPPDVGSDLLFPAQATTTAMTNDLPPGTSVGTVSFLGNGYTLGGNALTLGGPILSSQGDGPNAIGVALDFTGPASVAVENTDAVLTLGGSVSGAGGLTKTGGGQLVLSAANTYTGATAVEAGTLLVDGTTPGSTFIVAAGATLGGDGSIGAIQASGIVRPGLSGAGQLTSFGDATLGAGSTFRVALNGTGAGQFGSLRVAGQTTLDGTALDIDLGFVPTANESFVLIDNLGSQSVIGTFAGLPEDAIVTTSGGAVFRISYVGGDGNDVVLTHLTDSTTTLVATPESSVFGQSVTFTATVTGATTPTGTVEFYSGATLLGSATLDSGTATFTTAQLPVGAASITAKYLGDATVAPSTSAGVAVDVAQATTTVDVAIAPSVLFFGQSATLTATVSVVAPGAGTPTGTVEFFAGSTSLGTAALVAGVATLDTAALPVGTSDITAQYLGDTSFAGATSSPLSQTVQQAATTTSLTAAPTSTVFGQPVTLTVAVAAVAPGAGVPAGAVEFFAGLASLGTAILVNGEATLITGELPVGDVAVTARYLGDVDFAPSTSDAVTVTVAQAATTTTLAAVPNPSVFGQSVTFTATVEPVVTGAGTQNGTVEFFSGATSLGTATLSNGTASLSTASLPLGTSSITARYLGNDNFSASDSDALSQQVNQAATTTTVTTTPNPSVFGQSVTLTATVAAAAPGAGAPTGSVEFFNGSTSLGTVALSDGVATLATTALPVGTAALTARYLGDANFLASTSTAASQQVNRASTSISLAVSDANPSAFTPVTLTATLAPVAPGAGTPTGVVTFYANGTVLGSAVVVGGQASLTTTDLPVGVDSLDAVYEGDANFAPSTSTTQTVVVGTANERYVNQLYIMLLNRTAEPQGLSFWAGLLDRGYSRNVVVRGIGTTREARQIAVQNVYQAYLGRSAAPWEVARVIQVASSKGVNIRSVVLGTREYFNNAGGTIAGYLSALAADTIGRSLTPAAEVALTGRLQHGTPLYRVAEQVLVSPIGSASLVQWTYYDVLGREPSPEELNTALGQLKRGLRLREFNRYLLASEEFYATATAGA